MKQVDQNYKRSENILSPISELNSEGFTTIDNGGTIRRFNPADERPINATGSYNTLDANEKTVRAFEDVSQRKS